MRFYVAQIDGAAFIVPIYEMFSALDASGEIVQHTPGALLELDEARLAELGIVRIDVEIPPGQRFESATPILEAGVPSLEIALGDIPPEPVPDQVAMHRAHKAMMLTPWPSERNFGAEGGDLYDAALLAMAALPPPSDKLARAEFLRAPNIVRSGATTANVATLLGMSAAEIDALFLFAQTLP